MEIRKVTAMYLSCTGTTKKVVEAIARSTADKLGAEYAVFDFTLPKARESVCEYGAGELVICGTPVYAGRVPNLFLPYLKEKIKGKGALAVPVVLFGNRNFDDALSELRDLLSAAGFCTIAAGAFVGEHSFSEVLGAGRPDGEDMKKAEQLAVLAAERAQKIPESYLDDQNGLCKKKQTGDVLADFSVPISVPGASPAEIYYTPRDRHGKPIDIRKVKPKTSEGCKAAEGCRICAEICPMGAIDFDDPSQIKGICIKCGACVKKCPQKAKYYDDQGYLYHKTELEEIYTRRAESTVY